MEESFSMFSYFDEPFAWKEKREKCVTKCKTCTSSYVESPIYGLYLCQRFPRSAKFLTILFALSRRLLLTSTISSSRTQDLAITGQLVYRFAVWLDSGLLKYGEVWGGDQKVKAAVEKATKPSLPASSWSSPCLPVPFAPSPCRPLPSSLYLAIVLMLSWPESNLLHGLWERRNLRPPSALSRILRQACPSFPKSGRVFLLIHRPKVERDGLADNRLP